MIKTSKLSSTFWHVFTIFVRWSHAKHVDIVDGSYHSTRFVAHCSHVRSFLFFSVFHLMPLVYGVVCQLNYHGGGMLRCLQEGLHYMFPSSMHLRPLRVGEDVKFQVAEKNGQLQAVDVSPAAASPVSRRKLDQGIARNRGKGKSSAGSIHRLQTRTCGSWSLNPWCVENGICLPPSSRNMVISWSFHQWISRSPSFRQTYVGEALGWFSMIFLCKLCSKKVMNHTISRRWLGHSQLWTSRDNICW